MFKFCIRFASSNILNLFSRTKFRSNSIYQNRTKFQIWIRSNSNRIWTNSKWTEFKFVRDTHTRSYYSLSLSLLQKHSHFRSHTFWLTLSNAKSERHTQNFNAEMNENIRIQSNSSSKKIVLVVNARMLVISFYFWTLCVGLIFKRVRE